MEQVRAGKQIEDAREGGCSGCIETGAFGKEAYILTGYLNVPKILELMLNNGADRRGPTAVIKSLGKMDQVKSGGTLLNQRFLPGALQSEADIEKLMHLIRSYF